MISSNSKVWEELCSEAALLKWLDLEKKDLDYFRQQGFPYIRLSKKKRVYHLPSVHQYLLDRQVGGSDRQVSAGQDQNSPE